MKLPKDWYNKYFGWLEIFNVVKKRMKMKIRVDRIYSGKDHTNSRIYINDEFVCYGLEDQFREVKVFGETRIPNGTYKVTFRTIGGKHAKHLSKYGAEFHRGMIWIRDVPGFKYILVHAGNTDRDTYGCLLVGSTMTIGKNFIGGSVKAYKKFYPVVRDALLEGQEVTIKYKDIS